ncbi:MAG TPA: hypothetical protein VIG76_11810 [Amnibacterium sp.]|jgi:hypothetical protein|uniref:hypothetical protein n=1 Tax=Amnibacterium sp. TaxID=1872496 RepID=UPI002F95E45C
MWDAFVAWFQSAAGQRVLYSAVIPAVAIIVAGLIAALIARGAVRALLTRADRDAVAGSVAALVEAARVRAGGSTDRVEDERIDRLRTEADIRLRLARPKGSALAADWASLRLDAIERSGSSPVRQGTAEADEVRERLLAWVARPGRAKRLFAEDIERLGAERDARRTKAGITRSAPPEAAPRKVAAPAPAAAPAAPAGAPDGQGADDATGSAAVAARLKTHRDRIENQPEPVSAREQNRRDEPAREQPVAQAEAAPPAADPPPSTEPVLVQRTRLDSLDRSGEDARLEHSRHARAEAAAAAAAAAPAEQDAPAPAPAAAPSPEPASAEAPAAVAVPATVDEQPAPSQKQPVPAWLDTYDDEADVTRDIDLSKTPPPMSASAVRDRTRTGDDIVPRH